MCLLAYILELFDPVALKLAFALRATARQPSAKAGGAEGDRTPDLSIANATLSQLSYGPIN